ncbi:hypothetical protein QBC35DRAFT_172566 [Podospora australis]|uniref:NACHT-NTPase and P-loop NTPases N-terminal domain-containing protein n=1 Tax=Podospora australis TaxID=1536484 RepID=A0AAN6WHY0_9PEZI|nr:hypothetical protein QBC35DRAFT_172566 [Podospora australis]
MEALEAIGLASNILQFIEVGTQIVKEAREIYSSATGTTNEFRDLEHTCNLLSRLSANLVPSKRHQEIKTAHIPSLDKPCTADVELAALALRCKDASDNLSQNLRNLRLGGKSLGRLASL